MEFSIAVEDSLDMARFINQRMNTKVILFDRPWNRNGDSHSGIRRCMTWEEIDRLNPLSSLI